MILRENPWLMGFPLHACARGQQTSKLEFKTLIKVSTPSRPTFKPPKYGLMMPMKGDNP
jgi:hypothetical protein